MYDLGFVNRLSRPVVVLDGLPGLYGFKYDSATACGLPLYLYSYKLVGSATLSACLTEIDFASYSMARTKKTPRKSTRPKGVPHHQLTPRNDGASSSSSRPDP